MVNLHLSIVSVFHNFYFLHFIILCFLRLEGLEGWAGFFLLSGTGAELSHLLLIISRTLFSPVKYLDITVSSFAPCMAASQDSEVPCWKIILHLKYENPV